LYFTAGFHGLDIEPISPTARMQPDHVKSPLGGQGRSALGGEAMADLSRPRMDWMLKAVILASGGSAALAFTVVAPMLSRMSLELAHGPVDAYMVKMVSGVLGPAMVLGAAGAGFLADKIDRRWAMVGASLLFALAGAAPFALSSLPLILVARFLTGVAAVSMATIGATMVGVYVEEDHRPGWMGALASVAMISAVVSLPLAGWLADKGWRWPFLMYLPAILVAGLALVAMKRPEAQAEIAQAPQPRASAVSGKYPIALILLALVVGIVINVPGIYISFYLRNLGVASAAAVGVILMLNALAAAGFSAAFGRVRRKVSARVVFYYGFAAMAVGIGALALAPTYPIAVAALLVMGVGMGWLTPNMMSSVVEAVDEHHRGRALGAMNSAQSIAPALGVSLLEPLVGRIGIPGVLLLTAGLAALTLGVIAARGLGQGTPTAR
jgi:MFS family permease